MKKCNNCKNCMKLFMNDPWFCGKVKQPEIRNKYTNQIEQHQELYSFKELNSKGNCKYYEPTLTVKIKEYFKSLYNKESKCQE